MAVKPTRARKPSAFEWERNGKVVIAPSILSADFSRMGQQLGVCRRARAPWIHIDVMDGRFVPNLTMGPPLVQSWRVAEPDLFFDAHLMVERPMPLVPAFREAGSQLVTIHVEATSNPTRDLRAIKRQGLKAGISIKPTTSVRSIKDCLHEADLVLVMTVEPGFGGQALIPKTLNKVRELDLLRQKHELPFRLQVDGGINKKTAHLAVAAGADVLVAGSAVFSGGAVQENLKGLREALAKNSPAPPTRALRRRSRR